MFQFNLHKSSVRLRWGVWRKRDSDVKTGPNYKVAVCLPSPQPLSLLQIPRCFVLSFLFHFVFVFSAGEGGKP